MMDAFPALLGIKTDEHITSSCIERRKHHRSNFFL